MASSAEVARRYFEALRAHDVEEAAACWAPGGIDSVGGEELIAPDGVRDYFSALFSAFPDFRFEVLDLVGQGDHAAARWRARATFAGPGSFQGFEPNGARIEIEGCDMLTVSDDRIQRNHAYLDGSEVARQLGVLPPAGSAAEARLTKLANARTRMRERVHGVRVDPVAEGVWVARGGFPLKTFNVYLLEDDGGVTVFDAGISDMASGLYGAAVRLGPVKRIVLGHADADHRGAAPSLGAPVFCHPAEREAAQSTASHRPYWDLSKLAPHGRVLMPRLISLWDGGAVEVEGTVSEGDEVCGFRVLELPGHAPGLIGLYREADRLALVSDCFYTLDPQTGIKGPPRIPHPAFDQDVEEARASIRKVAELEPAAAWPGHADPVTGDVASELRRAAAAAL